VTDEPTAFLYPFIESDERGTDTLLADLADSARTKMAESRRLRAATRDTCAGELARAGAAMAARFGPGGRLFAFGNGGSATDAESAVDLFVRPPWGRALSASSLVDDRAVLTALANDVGFDLVFSRQLIAYSRAGDIALGFSTSGDSRNVLQAFAEGHRRGLLTVGLCGYDGGAMAASDDVDHCFVVRSESVHRIQEAQDGLVSDLWSVVQEHLGAVPATGGWHD
jgi:D-sedoheptulose 7-phosphate isomerase